MRLAALRVGDRIEVEVRGQVFRATVDSLVPGSYVKIKDTPSYVTYRFVSPRRVRKKLVPRQERLGVGL